ncbi:hypothetical protein [Streptomyces sp. SID161]|nr:hypothetical protein [Streptomyces sp. SID161]
MGGRLTTASIMAGLQPTQRGFGRWARIYREPEGSKRRCVQL